MRKLILTLLLAVMTVGANAQFKKGTPYLAASLSGLNLSYSGNEDITFGANILGGYFIEDAWMLYGKFGYDHTKNTDNFAIGVGFRYYFLQNGIYLGGGLQYEHVVDNVNNVQLCPEVGYAFYLNRYVTIEPALYYNMSLNDFTDGSKVGLKLGVGIYF